MDYLSRPCFGAVTSRILILPRSTSGSDVATLINDYINRGAIVPVEITIGLLEKVGGVYCHLVGGMVCL